MAKTPMMRRLLRTLRLVRGAQHTNIPLDEYVDMQREARAHSRRRFLEMAATGASLAAVTAACGGDDVASTSPTPASDGGSGDGGLDGTVPDASLSDGGADSTTYDANDAGDANDGAPEDAGSAKKVVIVGAGMAGLHCAYRLKKDYGVTATVYEASKRAGGRMFTDRTTFPNGQHCEIGGELIDTDHTWMHDLATELGIELYNYADDVGPDGGVLTTTNAYLGGTLLHEADLLAGFGPIAAAIDAANATIPDGIGYNAITDAGASLDAMSITQWLDSINASGPMRRYLEISYLTEFGLDPEVSNCLNLLNLIGTDTSSLALYGDSDEQFHTKTGNSTYIEKLQAKLDSAQVVFESRLVRLLKNADGRYTLTFTQGGTTFDVIAEHVVLALPFSILRDVDTNVEWAPAKARAIQELGYGQNTKLMAGFSSRPWRDQGSSGEGFYDLPIQSSWETSRLQPGASGIITCYTGAGEAVVAGTRSVPAQLQLFLDDWEKVYPGSRAASNGLAVRGYWPGNPLTKGSYASYLVGQYSAFSGAEIERAENIHFCGEHTSIDQQGYMEGAAATGATCAQEIAADLGISVQGSYRRKIQTIQRRELFMLKSMFG